MNPALFPLSKKDYKNWVMRLPQLWTAPQALNWSMTYFAHALPIVLEILCLLAVGIYGQFYYEKTLAETEALVALMLFATGLQNGLTASISNFSVKTTHLTGTTTDLGILASMFTQKKF